MFDLERAIQKWLKQFRKHKEFHDASIKEMEAHLRDHIDDLQADGLESSIAFEKAVAEFGPLKFTAQEAYKSQKPTSQRHIDTNKGKSKLPLGSLCQFKTHLNDLMTPYNI